MMTSMMSKQLCEFLQEQQEPFILDVYLLERGCQRSRFHSECGSAKGTRCLKRSGSCGLKRNRKFIPNCSKIMRSLFSRILTVNNDQKTQDSGRKHQNTTLPEVDNSRREIANDDNFSSASSATVFNSCSDSDAEDVHCSCKKAGMLSKPDHYQELQHEHLILENVENEVAAGWKFRWKGTKDSKQLSPVSVLEETDSCDNSPVCRKNDATRMPKKHSASVSLRKSEKRIYLSIGEVQDFYGPAASSQYTKNKKAVQETKQLLFDCVKEVVEKHKKESRGQEFTEILGAEQLWELICENLWLWSKESINETNITPLLHLDVLESIQEWNDLKQPRQEIGIQLGDAILEDISSEIITDMINFSS